MKGAGLILALLLSNIIMAAFAIFAALDHPEPVPFAVQAAAITSIWSLTIWALLFAKYRKP